MPIDHFAGGTTSGRHKLNQLVDEANIVATLRGDERFITVTKGPGGTLVSLRMDAVRQALVTAAANIHNLLNGGIHPDTFADAVGYDKIVAGQKDNVAVAPLWGTVDPPISTGIGPAFAVWDNTADEGSRIDLLQVALSGPETGKTLVSVDIVEGDPNTVRFQVPTVTPSATTVLWGKAQAVWVNASGNGSYVSCKTVTNKAGDGEAGSAFNVYLPRTGTQDPNVQVGDVIGYILDANGVAVCVTDYLDAKIGTVGMFNGAWVDSPVGWNKHLPNGSTTRGFPRSATADNQTSSGGGGAEVSTGGHDWHGQTENNHNDHDLSHVHAQQMSGVSVGGTVNVMLGGSEPTWEGGTDLPTREPPTTDGYSRAKHKGPYNGGAGANSDTDNKPVWFGEWFMIRVEPGSQATKS